MKRYRIFVVAVTFIALATFLGVPQALLANEHPQDSYYQLDVPLETQLNKKTSFAALRGKPVLVSMFYGSCPHVCPMLISTVKEVEKQLPPATLRELRVAMISVDPQRDTPEKLKELADRHDVDNERWLLARTAPGETRALAAVLGIKYRALPDGQYNHTSAIILLDGEGREIARSHTLGRPDAAFVEHVKRSVMRD